MTASPLMTLAECGAYLRFTHPQPSQVRNSTLKWLRLEDVPMVRRGRVWLVRQRDVDAALNRHASGNTEERASR